jgi:hypothetical protein
MLLDWLADKHGDERCAKTAASIRTGTTSVLASGPKTRDLGETAGTAEVTQAIRSSLISPIGARGGDHVESSDRRLWRDGLGLRRAHGVSRP